MSDIWTQFRDSVPHEHMAAWRLARLEALRLSGLFLAEYYAEQRGKVPAPLEDYHDSGWRAGHWPNPYFDPTWYAARYADVAAAGTDPLAHYVSYGEAEGRQPVEWFDPAWYRAHHDVPAGQHALAHFLLHRFDGSARPIAEFDSRWYLATYPDVAAAGMDPMEHFRIRGFREGRRPSHSFDTQFYRMRYLQGLPDENPVLHYRRHRGEAGVHTSLPLGETTVANEVRRYSAPGPAFEDIDAKPPSSEPLAQILAFYLPQYHPIAENDTWWGAGFTEWTNIARGLPRFAGHYQPRTPRDLGHYRLDNPDVMRQQAALAASAGLGGFVFYYYRFGCRRLLERPIENYLADQRNQFPYCLMWANENWTRRWDGASEQVLLEQTYDPAFELDMVADFARHFTDQRYIRLGGRPLLMLYRAGVIPDCATAVQRWRNLFRTGHGEDPILVMAQSFDDHDPRLFGLDGAVEFPPHRLVKSLPLINHTLAPLDHEFSAQVYSYADAADAACVMPQAEFPLIRCALPGWDNDARRQGRGMVLHGATPARYQAWLTHLIADARTRPFFGSPMVCINAWNEWAEGAYLEPDQHFGGAFLNATRRAAFSSAEQPGIILLVGHDAFAAGAQLLLLHIARQLIEAHGARVEFILLAGGALAANYRAIAPVYIVDQEADVSFILRRLRSKGCKHALVNSAVSTPLCPALAAEGFAITLLVHEMPGLLERMGLQAKLALAINLAQTTVFAAAELRDAVAPAAPRCTVLPQGVYRDLRASAVDAAALRVHWRVADDQRLAIGVGYADHRKGFDYFLQIFFRAGVGVHMAWIGQFDPETAKRWAADIAAAEATGRFHRAGWREDIGTILQAADLFVLTSREDPYPSAALEALSQGTPVVAFAASTGLPQELLHTVALADCHAMAACVTAAPRILQRRSLLPPHYGFDTYVSTLLRLVNPGPQIDVVITSYDQADLMPRRLKSVFSQTMPTRTITVWDDASHDGTDQIAARTAAQAGRSIRIVAAQQNSGSPFGHWCDAVAATTGDLIWIAEADDIAEPEFLASLAQRFAEPSVVLAFCDSRPVERDLTPRVEDYRVSYQAAGGLNALAADGIYDAKEFAERFLSERNILFNVSAVLWRRDSLLAALQRLEADLPNWQVAGDWRIYIELLMATAGRVAHLAQPLNLHCRDAGSASARVPARLHLAEIERMHAVIRSVFGNIPGLFGRQAAYLREAERYLTGQAPDPQARRL